MLVIQDPICGTSLVKLLADVRFSIRRGDPRSKSLGESEPWNKNDPGTGVADFDTQFADSNS